MAEIGFKKTAGRHYVHPECDIFVEFVEFVAALFVGQLEYGQRSCAVF